MSAVAIAGISAAAVVLLGVTLWALLARRAANRRLENVLTRLEGHAPAAGAGPFTDDPMGRLERVAEAVTTKTLADQAAVDRMGEALEALEQGVVLCDEDGKVVYRNRLAQAYAGARHAEALAEQATEDVLMAALAGERQVRSVDLYGPPRRNLKVAAMPLTDGRRAIGAVAVIEDISERRRLEAVRRDFVANVSHELKTPVGALGLLAETLADEEDPGVTRRLAERMQLEAARVARIIDDLLDLSRLEAEEAPVREPVPMHLIVAQAVEQVTSAAEQRRVSIDVAEIPKRLTVVGDRRQLVSAVYNLLENAVKYSADGDHVEVLSRTGAPWTEVAVCDHGIGIPSRDHERIFERFYRVDRARGRDTGGTGLGLAIVRHVVTNHGGDVTVASREGDGSVFTLRLPTGPGLVAVDPPAAWPHDVHEAG
jgi:two-component system sensor histidine kinase SenX3